MTESTLEKYRIFSDDHGQYLEFSWTEWCELARGILGSAVTKEHEPDYFIKDFEDKGFGNNCTGGFQLLKKIHDSEITDKQRQWFDDIYELKDDKYWYLRD